MNMFANLTNDNLEESSDRLGGFESFESNAYDATIKVAYVGKAASSNAQSVTVVADIDGRELRETIWITTKDGNNFYMGKGDDSQKKFPLPGFTTIDDLCLLTTGQPLAEQATEEKVVKIYNFDERKEVPTSVPVLTGLTGQSVKLGVLREIVDKQKKGDDGKYHNTGETRTQNVIDKVFHAESGRTVNEFRHEVATAEFLPAWTKKNAGKDRNRAKGVQGAGGPGNAGNGRPGGAAGGGAKKSLFG